MKHSRYLLLTFMALLLCFSQVFAADSKADASKKAGGAQGESKMNIYLDGKPLKDLQALQIDKQVFLPLKDLCARIKVACEAAPGAVTIQGKKVQCETMEKDGILYAEYAGLKAAFPYRISLNRVSNIVALWSPEGIKPYQPEPDHTASSGSHGQRPSQGGGGTGQPGEGKLMVTASRRASDATYADRVIMECRVENLTPVYARGITVTMIVHDPSGLSGFDGTTTPRTYGTYTASIPELKPNGSQWVSITTGLARPIAVNEGGNSGTITMELVGPSKEFAPTRVNLQYFFEVQPTSMTEQ